MSKRELIDTGTDKCYVGHDEESKSSAAVSHSLSADKRYKGTSGVKVGGDRRDRRGKH